MDCEDEDFDFVFKHPFTCILGGPSKSGKTTLLIKILLNINTIIDKPPSKIIYCYSRMQEKFNDLLVIPNFYIKNSASSRCIISYN